MRERLETAQAIVLVGGRAFVAYPYRDAEPVPEGVAVFHVADNPEAFGREHAADMALLGKSARRSPRPQNSLRTDRRGQVEARLVERGGHGARRWRRSGPRFSPKRIAALARRGRAGDARRAARRMR